MCRCLIVTALLLAAFATACGSREPKNPYEEADRGEVKLLNAQRYAFQNKVLAEGIDTAFIAGDDHAMDIELWLYDVNDDIIAIFPMKLRFSSVGIAVWLWVTTRTIPKIKNIDGKQAVDLLGTYSGMRYGIDAAAGQTVMDLKNESGVQFRLISDRAGVGVDLSAIKMHAIRGCAEHAVSWDSVIKVNDRQSW